MNARYYAAVYNDAVFGIGISKQAAIENATIWVCKKEPIDATKYVIVRCTPSAYVVVSCAQDGYATIEDGWRSEISVSNNLVCHQSEAY